MRRVQFILITVLALPILVCSQTQHETDSTVIRSIYTEVLANGECYENLEDLCKDIAARLSGSKEADKAIAWGKTLLEEYGFKNVHLQDVEVPHWSRGDIEEGWFESKGEKHPTKICALGGSVGSGGPISGQVVEVKTFEDLEVLGREKVEGKIVFFNKAMDPVLINTGAAYGGAYYQ